MKTNIRAMRKRAGLTQAELAKAVGVNLSTVGNWERFITCPDAEQVWNCAIACECSPNDILGWQDETVETLTIDEREIVTCYRESTPQWKQNISMTARAASGESKKKTKHNLSTTSKREAI